MNRLHSIGRWIWKPFAVIMDHPVLIKTSKFNIVGFGIFASIESIVMLLFFAWYLELHGTYAISIPPQLYVLGAIMIWIGAKVFHWMALGKKFFFNPLKYIKETGFYMQGGVIGAFLWLIVLSVTQNISFTILADALCWGGLIGQVIGRLGCFNYGCCFGKPVKYGFGVHYRNPDSKIIRWKPELYGVKVHPTQLYTAGLHLSLFFVIWFLLPVVPSGTILLTFFIWLGLTRIAIEHFRFDIIYEEGRNWTSFFTALAFIITPIALVPVLSFLDTSFLKYSTLESSPSVNSLFVFIYSNPLLISIILSLGLIIFLGYGIHGKKLGTFPGISFIHNTRHRDVCSVKTAHSGAKNI